MTGEDLKMLLIYNKVTLVDLAHKLGMSQQALANRLKASNVKSEFINTIVKALEKDLKPVSISMMGESSINFIKDSDDLKRYKDRIEQLERLVIEKDNIISERDRTIMLLQQSITLDKGDFKIENHPSEDSLIITDELIVNAATARGGYTRKQLQLLGIDWPPPKGWKSKCIGKQITKDDYNELMRLKCCS